MEPPEDESSATAPPAATTGKVRAGLRGLSPWIHLAARTVVLLIGCFALVNVAVTLRHPAFDPNIWWIDLRMLPRGIDQALMATAALGLIATSLRPLRGNWSRWVAPGILVALAAVAVWNGITFYQVWSAGLIRPAVPIPLSAVIAVVLLGCAGVLSRPAPRLRRVYALGLTGFVSVCFLVFVPLMQEAFFGTTDYRRPADAIVVFGAMVGADGKASYALADRVDMAVELYHEGLARTIIMTGGVERNGWDETVVMKKLAVSEGVPADAIVMDPYGNNTQDSVNDTVALLGSGSHTTLLAVSHFYHLARIKLTYARAGIDVLTVPSRLTPIRENPMLVAREVPAFWEYYVRAALS